MIISRHILHPEIIVNGFDRDNLCNMIDYWKVLLWEKFEMRPGEKIALGTSSVGPYYISLLLASFELGLIVVVTDSMTSESVNPYHTKQSVYEDLKLCIYDDANNTSYSLKNNALFFKILCHIDIFDTYQIQDPELYNKLKNKLFATPNDVALHTTSSGTTGTPRVITKTHKYLIDSSTRQIKVWDFKPNDRVLHTRQISHGAVFDLFWLPSLMACREHWIYIVDYNSSSDVKEWLSIIYQNKISKIFLTSTHHCDLFLNSCQTFDYDIDIIAIGTFKDSWSQLVKEKNITRFIVSYGATELGNAVLINECNPSNADEFIKNTYYFPDNAFEIVEYNDTSTTFVNHFDNDLQIVLQDRWQPLDSHHWQFLGRTSNFKINDTYVTEAQLSDIVKKYIKNEFAVVIDTEYQDIYLAVYDQSIDSTTIEQINMDIQKNIGANLSITKYSEVLRDVVVGAKFKSDLFMLRGFFRKKVK
jgi:hypothetical protein